MIISFTGCQTKGLLSYQNAARTTQAIEKGEVLVEVNLMNTFDKTGLAFEVEKELSDYERISTKVISKYDNTENEQMETNIYFISGGMGIDASLFSMDEQLILQLPIINMYMVLNEGSKEQFLKADEELESTDLEVAAETMIAETPEAEVIINIDVEALLNIWLNILNEENIVVGNNTYVNTKEGQIKTTEYSFHISENQIQELMKALINEIDFEKINKFIQQQTKAFDDTKIFVDIESLLNMIKLTRLEGKAFVDFDNRLIRQEFVLYGEGNTVEPGDLETFQIEFNIEYTNLGKEQQFDFPTLTEENVVNQEQLEEIFDMLENIGGL
jgi:hypothetical protein